jgi:hypothetical protein
VVNEFGLMIIAGQTKSGSFVGDYRLMRVGDNGRSHLNGSGWVDSLSGLSDDSVEPSVMVGRVLDGTSGAIGFNQAVVAFNFVTYSLLSLFLDVVSMCVLNSVPKFVLRWGLEHKLNTFKIQ